MPLRDGGHGPAAQLFALRGLTEWVVGVCSNLCVRGWVGEPRLWCFVAQVAGIRLWAALQLVNAVHSAPDAPDFSVLQVPVCHQMVLPYSGIVWQRAIQCLAASTGRMGTWCQHWQCTSG